jgi:hypothetical protein
MPDQSSAADEHALLKEITAPLASLPDDAVHLAADADFPIAFRGYDRLAVDAYVKRVSQVVAELQSTRSPEAAVRRALERVGDQISGILQRAHETAEQITTQSRREAEDRLVVARQEAAQIAAAGEQRVKDLDAETDRIWAERLRIVEDARELAAQLLALADEAAARFPPADDTTSDSTPGRPAAVFDAEVEEVDEEEELASEQPERAPDEVRGEVDEPGEAAPDGEAPESDVFERSVPPPAPASGPPPAPASGPPPPVAAAEPEDDPDATAILPPNRRRGGEQSHDGDEAPPTVRMPTPEEPDPTAEHPVRPPSQPPPSQAPPEAPPGAE